MAYNPFNIFRRNQKALFAVLTVFIMIMFTLSFGSGDAIDRLSRWLGGGRSRGEAVCKLDGGTIKSGDTDRVRRGRVVANSFMSAAADETLMNLRRYTDQQRGKLSPEGQRMAEAMDGIGFAMFNPSQAQRAFMTARFTIRSVAENPDAKSEDKDAARAYQAQLDLMDRRFASAEDRQFFLNAPNRTTRDVIEFMLWEKKADQLGIRFTRNDVHALIGREFYGYFKSDVEVRKALQKQIDAFNLDACLDALAVEFKVRAAQAAVLGPIGRVTPGAPVYGTPYEMFEFYRDQCSPAKYEVVAVPAEAFIEKVQGEPSESELKALYDKYANDEPNPSKEGFGFKEPRKLAISWLALTGDEPYYQKLAADQIKAGEVMAKAWGLTAVPVPGVGAAWAEVAAAPLALKEPAVDAAYTRYKTEFADKVHQMFGGGAYDRSALFTRDLLPTSTVRAGTAAAVLGGLSGQLAPFGHPTVGSSVVVSAAIAYEIRDRVKTGLPLVLGASPGPALLQTALGGAAAYTALAPQPLSIEAVRPELLKTTVSARAKVLAYGSDRFSPNSEAEKGDLARFNEQLDKLSDKGRAKDKTAVNEYIKKFMADRGLTKPGEQFGSTTQPRDEWTIEEDPGLRPLVTAQRESLGRARGAHGGDRYLPFGRSFFWVTMPNQPRRPTTGSYVATPYPPDDRGGFGDEGRPRYVYWVTEDVQPKKTSLLTMKDQVRAAWKQIKAREMAKQRAEAISEALRKDPSSSAALLKQSVNDQVGTLLNGIPAGNKSYFRASKSPFAIDNVSPLTPIDLASLTPEVIQMMAAQGISPFGQLRRFGLTESETIPYPTREMETALIDNRDKPFKTVLVLPDAPKDTFYVAVLTNPSNDPLAQKSASAFAKEVYPRTAPAHVVIDMYTQEAIRKARQSFVALLKKEFRYEETEEQKKKLDDNAKSGGRD